MEEKIIEQPFMEDSEISEKAEENPNGSILGKFKDAKSLLDAYNNLQSEFTRKSQKLAEFQKKSEENAAFENYETLDEFLAQHTDSDEYKKDITEILTNDNEVCNLPNKYQVALKIAKLAESKSAEKLNSQDYLDKYVAGNEKIQQKIISDYLSNLNNISSTPKTTFGSSAVYFSPSSAKPKTLQEAGEILKNMLK